MKQLRPGLTVAVKGIVRGVNIHPTEGVYVDVETASGDGLMSSIHGVDILHLEDLEPPKKDLVVIPIFIADWLEKCKIEKDNHSLSSAIGDDVPFEVSNWLSFDDCRNEEVFARAWIEGYEVEKEPLYWVRNRRGRAMLGKKDDGTIYGASYVTITSQLAYPKSYTFTEKEIKDYDERYWAFAVPVEEE